MAFVNLLRATSATSCEPRDSLVCKTQRV